MKPLPSASRRPSSHLWNPHRIPPATRGEDGPAARERIRVPSTPSFPSGLGCDVVETSVADGERILGFLPTSGCVLTNGKRWSWIVPIGSDIGVEWPPLARYLVDAAVLVPHGEPHPAAPVGHSVVHPPDQAAPYTHPLLLYFAVCHLAGIQPAVSTAQQQAPRARWAGQDPRGGDSPKDGSNVVWIARGRRRP